MVREPSHGQIRTTYLVRNAPLMKQISLASKCPDGGNVRLCLHLPTPSPFQPRQSLSLCQNFDGDEHGDGDDVGWCKQSFSDVAIL